MQAFAITACDSSMLFCISLSSHNWIMIQCICSLALVWTGFCFLFEELYFSLQHSPLNQENYLFAGEAARIRKRSGRVFSLPNEPDVTRVWLPKYNSPGLAMARAFGDFCLKNYGVISVPDVSYHRITEKDEFIVLATDGVSNWPHINLNIFVALYLLDWNSLWVKITFCGMR